MKKIFRGFALLISVLIFQTGFTQIEDPVKWKVSSNKISDCEYELVFTGTIDEHWHVYSLTMKGDDGPMPSKITVDKSKDYEVVGKTTEGKPIKGFDKVFEMDVAYFEKTVTFKQKIKLLTDKEIIVKGNYEYQACTEEKCIFPPATPFEFKLKGKAACVSSPAIIAVTKDTASQIVEPAKWNFSANKLTDSEFELVLKAQLDKGWHMYGQKSYGEDGPKPTSFVFIKNPN